MGTDETVQIAEVQAPVPEGPVATTTAAPTLDDIKRMVAEETEKVKRAFQSEKDIAIKRARQESEQAIAAAEERAAAVMRKLAEGDPEGAASLQLADRDAKLNQYQRREQEAAAIRQAAEFDNTFKTNMAESLKALGIDPTDKKIDWAEDAGDYFQRQQRILHSAGKLQQSQREKDKMEWKEEFAKFRREQGFDSVDTSTPAGTGSRTFTRKQIAAMSDTEFAEKREAIQKAQEDNLIK